MLKKSKKTLALILSLILVLGMFPMAASAGVGSLIDPDTGEHEIFVNLFDYGSNVNSQSTYLKFKNDYINKDNATTVSDSQFPDARNKFNGTDNDYQTTHQGTAVPGIVQSTLTGSYDAGYSFPTFSGTGNGDTGYLFDTAARTWSGTGTGRTVYANVPGLFSYNSATKQYYYSSSATSAAKIGLEAGAARHAQYVGGEIRLTEASGYFLPFNSNAEAAKGPGGGGAAGSTYTTDNYWLGMSFEVPFIQPKGGKIGTENMKFSFSGDDDVWVFLDGKLVLDMGGIHQPVTGEIDFATGTATVTNYRGGNTVRNLQGTVKGTVNGTPTPFENFSNHTLSFFYLERGGTDANCSISFNLWTLGEDQLVVYKNISNMNTGIAQPDISFSYQLKPWPPTTEIPAAASYTVTDTINNTVSDSLGFDVVDGIKTFSLKHGQYATISGLTQNSKVEVVETGISGTDLNLFSAGYETVQIDDRDAIDVRDNEGTVSTSGLTVGNVGSVRFTNKIDTRFGELKIQKQISPADYSTTDSFSFNVFIGGSLTPYAGKYTIGTTEYTATNGKVVLQKGQTATISGIPVGTSYSVVEVDLSTNKYGTPTYANANGTIKKDTIETAIITNNPKAELTVVKAWGSVPTALQGSVTVQLLQNGSVYRDPVTISAAPWSYTFTELPFYKEAGVAAVYSVVETHINGVLTAAATADGTGSFNTPTYSTQPITPLTAGGIGTITVTNSPKPNQHTAIAVYKDWQAPTGTTLPTSITVELKYYLGTSGDWTSFSTPKTAVLNAGNGWNATFTGLQNYSESTGQYYTYTVVETGLPSTYSLISIVPADSSLTGFNNTFTITNRLNQETANINGVKTWLDGGDADNARSEIQIRLLQDGSAYNGVDVDGVAVTNPITVAIPAAGSNTTAYGFSNLPKYAISAEGVFTAYTYSLEEVGSPANYTPTQIGTDITNVRTGTTAVYVEKIWNTNGDDVPGADSVTISLLPAGSASDLVLSESNDWEGSFDNLPKYDAQGALITYSITEAAVTNYRTNIEAISETGYGFAFRVTNTDYTPGEVSLAVNKDWLAPEGTDFDTVTFTVSRYTSLASPTDLEVLDGTYTLSTPSGDTSASTTFGPFEQYKILVDEDGYEIGRDEYTYTVTEIVPTDYELIPSITPDTATTFYFTNRITGTTIVTVSKTWIDGDNGNLLRPGTITVYVKNGEITVATLTLTSEDNWASKETGPLPKYNTNGNEITYTIVEASVEHYSSSVGGFTVTNTLNQQYIPISGVKTWLDPADTVHPTITINLLQNGEVVDTVTLADGETSYTFDNEANTLDGVENLWPVFNEANDYIPYIYTVQEIDVPSNYTDSYPENTYNVTNRINDEETERVVHKIWVADPSVIPESITVTLWQDGEPYSDPVTLTAADINEFGEWEYTFSDLPKYRENRSEYIYAITEATVPYFKTEINGFVIKNTILQEYITIWGEKQWDIGDGESVFPTDVQVQLYADGAALPDALLTITPENLAFSFENLPKYAIGESDAHIIDYVVKEVGEAENQIVIGENTFIVTYGENDDHVQIIENSYNPYLYQLILNYETRNASGARTDYRTVTGAVTKGAQNGVFTEDPASYTEFDGHTYGFTDGTVEGELSVSYTVTLDEANHVYIIELNYVRTLEPGRDVPDPEATFSITKEVAFGTSAAGITDWADSISDLNATSRYVTYRIIVTASGDEDAFPATINFSDVLNGAALGGLPSTLTFDEPGSQTLYYSTTARVGTSLNTAIISDESGELGRDSATVTIDYETVVEEPPIIIDPPVPPPLVYSPPAPPVIDIEDTTPPLPSLDPEPDPDPLVDIEDAAPPLPDLPNTGDTAIYLPLFLLAGACVGILALLLTGKKRKD
jgi:fibro-slime domain-containing protein